MITATELRDLMLFYKENQSLCKTAERSIVESALDGETSCVINGIAIKFGGPMKHYFEAHDYTVHATDGDETYCVALVVSWEQENE